MRTGNSSFVSCLFVALPTVCSLKLWRSFSFERRKRKINENSRCNSRRYLSTWQSRTNWKFFRSFCSTYWDLQSSAWQTVKVIHRAGPLKAIALTSQCDRCPLLRPTILWFPSNLSCPSSEVFEFFWAPLKVCAIAPQSLLRHLWRQIGPLVSTPCRSLFWCWVWDDPRGQETEQIENLVDPASRSRLFGDGKTNTVDERTQSSSSSIIHSPAFQLFSSEGQSGREDSSIIVICAERFSNPQNPPLLSRLWLRLKGVDVRKDKHVTSV
jgi:hypothetical protein